MSQNLPNNSLFSIAEVAQIMGVSIATIRRWEREKKISALHTMGGHRRFSQHHIDLLRNIKTQPVKTPPVFPLKTIHIPKIISIRIIGNPLVPPKGAIVGRLMSFVIVLYSLIFIALNPTVLANEIKSTFKETGQVLGVSSTGGSGITLASTLDSNFNLSIKGVINTGGISNVPYNAFATSTQTPTKTSVITGNNDLYVGGDLEVAGTVTSTTSLNVRGNTNPLFLLESTSTAIPPKVQLINANGNQWHFGAFGSVDKFSFARTAVRDVFIADNSGANMTLTLDPGSTGSTLFPNGKVGIGTSTPGAALEIIGDWSTPLNALRLRGKANGTIYNYWDISSIFNYTNADLEFISNGAEKVRFNANGQVCIGYSGANCGAGSNSLLAAGNVGIGTTGPEGRLHVVGSTSSQITIGNPSVISNDAADGVLKIYGEQTGAVKYGLLDQTGSNFQLNGSTGGTNVQIISSSLNQFTTGIPTAFLDSSNTKYLQIQHDGSNGIISTVGTGAGGIRFKPVANSTTAFQFQNAAGTSIANVDTTNSRIGIGTTSPEETFHIFNTGTSTTLGQLDTNLRLQTNSQTVNGGAEISFRGHSQSAEDVATYAAISAPVTANGVGSAGYLSFSTKIGQAITSLTERMRITGAGLVGIGNVSPVGLLDVSGAVTGKALNIFNETGDQALLTASASGVAKFTIQHSGLVDATADGLATKVVAGAIVDGSFSGTVVDGLHAVDSSDGRFYFRYGGAWHYVAQTAGFQIPNYETFAYNFDAKSFDNTKPLADGDFLIPFAEKRLSDGAVHGLYAKLTDVADRIFKAVELVVKRLRTGKITITDDTVGSGLITKDTTEIEIQNSNINSDSLIYITPTSPTQNKVLYIKEKKDGSFKVGLSDSISEDINFNWWIIEKGK